MEETLDSDLFFLKVERAGKQSKVLPTEGHGHKSVDNVVFPRKFIINHKSNRLFTIDFLGLAPRPGLPRVFTHVRNKPSCKQVRKIKTKQTATISSNKNNVLSLGNRNIIQCVLKEKRRLPQTRMTLVAWVEGVVLGPGWLKEKLRLHADRYLQRVAFLCLETDVIGVKSVGNQNKIE